MSDGPVMRLNGVDYAAADERAVFSPLLMPGGTEPFSARSGKRLGPGLAVTVSGTTVTVSPGSGVIFDPDLAAAGSFMFARLAQKQIDLGERPGAGFTRVDLIVARVYDHDSGTGNEGQHELRIERVPGQPGSNPSAPDLPALSLELARATVPATGAVTVVQSDHRIVASGGILPVATTAERDALGFVYDGLMVYNAQTRRHEARVNGAWVPVAPWEKGTYTTNPSFTRATRTRRWERHGDQITVWGALQRINAQGQGVAWTAGNDVGLQGIPTPAESVTFQGRIGYRTAYLALDTSGLLTVQENTTGSGGATILEYDGLTYTAAS